MFLIAGLCQSREITLSPRILGGERAVISDYPWQLSLHEEGEHTCGASILSVNRALTAAHCYDNETPLDEYR